MLASFEGDFSEQGYSRGIAAAVSALLSAPGFLYRLERAAASTNAPGAPLAAPEVLAARLSFLFRGSAPDETLHTAAREGRLASVADVEREARRLSVWGATLGVNLQWTRHRVRCPLNVSRYRGLRLILKGSGSLPVQVATFDTTGPPGGGDCSEKCYDHHQVIVQASPEWTTHELRWEALHQEGWGKPAAFDAASVVGIYFAPRPADLPLDIWIDDVGFIEP